MKYILWPTQNDILHYAKGTESKAHKYISRAFKKGRWVYTYAKNKATGNAVTNKNGKKAGESNKMQYSPTVKTYANGEVREPANMGVYLRDTRTGATVNNRPENDPKIATATSKTVTNKNSNMQYSPTVKTVDVAKDIGAKVTDLAGRPIVKALAENLSPSVKASGLDIFNNLMKSHQTKSKGTSYSPPQSTKAARSRHYTPNESKFGRYKPLKGVSLSEGVDYDALEKEINASLELQDRNGYKVETITTTKKKKK